MQLDISNVTCARESIAVVSSGTGAVLTTCNNQLSAVSYLQDLNLYTFTCTGEPISGVSRGTGAVEAVDDVVTRRHGTAAAVVSRALVNVCAHNFINAA